MNWIRTLEARHAGAREGFLAADLPLEDQDVNAGGVRVEPVEEPANEVTPLPEPTPVPFEPVVEPADEPSVEDTPSSTARSSRK